MREVVTSQGWINTLRPTSAAGDALELTGWAAPYEGEGMTGAELRLGDRTLRVLECETQRPSPEIPRFHPHIVEPGRCRFRLVAELPEAERGRPGLVRLTPLFGAERGMTLANLYPEEDLAPPADQVDFVGGNWLVGLQFTGLLLDFAGLAPSHDVLDPGCGLGRMAHPLTRFLAPEARYAGFDVSAEAIDWAEKHIAPLHPGFHFTRVDLRNRLYNPKGTLEAAEFAFPYPDAGFDVALLASVFTHLLPPVLRHYLAELHRTLRPGGRCLFSCFVLNDESRALIDAGRSEHPIVHAREECWIANEKVPEVAVGFDEAALERWVRDAGFLVESRHDGSWCGRERFRCGHDFWVVRRR